MHHTAVGRISERVSDCRKVISAPLGGGVALRDLLGNEVSEHRELAGKVVIDSHNFFSEIGRHARTAAESSDTVADISESSGKDADPKKRGGISIDHARRDHVSRKR